MQNHIFRRGDRVEQRLDGETRRGVVASVGWSGCLGDVVVIHFDENPTGFEPDLVVSGDTMHLLAPSAA